MTRTASLTTAAAAVAALYAASLAITASSMFARAPETMGLGVTIDLTVTATALVYFLAVRRGHLSARALFLVFIGGLAVAWLAVPGAPVLVVWGFVEAAIAATALLKLRSIVRKTRALRRQRVGLVSALETALVEALPHKRLASILAVELAAIFYALFGWFLRAPAGMTMHRRRSWSLLAGTLAFLVIVETVGVHVIVSRFSAVAAWIATASSIYGLVWLLGDAHALRLNPLRIIDGDLVLELGIRWRVRVPLAEVTAIEPITSVPPPRSDLLAAHLLWPDLLLALRHPVTARGPFGIEKRVRAITLSLDEVKSLRAEWEVAQGQLRPSDSDL